MTHIKDDKIRILFLTDEFFSFSGGTEQHISFLLSNLPKDLYEIYFVLLRNTGFYNPMFYPINPIYLNMISFRSIGTTIQAIKKLSELIRKEKINIIQTFFYDSELLAVLTSRSRGDCVHIATRRNMGHHLSQYTIWRNRLTNRFISSFLANCEAVRNQVASSEWVPLERIAVIPNPLPQKRFEEGMKSLCSGEIYGLQEDEQVVGIVASMSWVKDHETFLRAARLILDRKPKTKFVLIGRMVPGRETTIYSLISSLHLESSIVWAGELLNPIPLMKLMDIGVLSSRSEGLSNTLIEYGAAGIPAVVTEVGGNSEIIVHDETGLIVPKESPSSLAQGILKLLEDDALRKKMGIKAQERVSRVFDEASILNQYHRFYREQASRGAC